MKSQWNIIKTAWALGVIGLLSFPLSALAIPFNVIVNGQLTAGPSTTDVADLNGATINIVHSADTTDTPSSNSINLGLGFVTTFFTSPTVVINITNRPNSAPDIIVLNNGPLQELRASNQFSPSTVNDLLFLTEGISSSVPGLGGSFIRVISPGIDLGSQVFLPGTSPELDLSFFNSLIGTTLTSFSGGSVTLNANFRTQFYFITNPTISIPETNQPVPEPSTMLLFGSGLAGMVAWRFKKQHAKN